MKDKVIAIATLISVAAGFPCGAETLTWYGPEGGLWSTEGNWTNSVGEAAIPRNGDRLVIPARADAMSLTNDIEGLVLERIAFTGPGASVTLMGNAYTLDNALVFSHNVPKSSWPFVVEGCVVTNGPAVVLKNSGATDDNHVGIHCDTDVTFVSTFSTDVTGYIYLSGSTVNGVYAPIRFLESFTALTGTIVGRGSSNVEFYAPINVKYICYPGSYSASLNIYFYASGNVFEDWQLGPFGTFAFLAENSVPEDTVLRWNYENPGNNSAYSVRTNTVIDHVAAFEPPLTDGKFDYKKCIVGGSKGPLTMRSTTNMVTYAEFTGWYDLVWDPIGDYTCEFRDRCNDLKGSYKLIINRGKAILSGDTVFKNSALVLGENVTVDVTATNGIVMPVLLSLDLAKDSRLYVTNASVQAFAAGTANATIEDGAYMEISDEVAPATFNTVYAYGTVVAPGVYTGEDNVEGALKVPWLRGSGTVTVINTKSTAGETYWKEPVSGDWSDPTKWTEGVPNSSRAAIVAALGADYTVTITNELLQECSWTVKNSFPHRTVLAVKAPLTTSGTRTVTLAAGGCFDVQTNGVCCAGWDPDLNIGPGGELRVSGGTCVLTNTVLDSMIFAGTPAHTAIVSVTAGRLATFRRPNAFRVGDYASLNVSGGEIVMDNDVGWSGPYERISVAPEGRVSISGTGKFKISRSYTGAPFGSGEATFSDDAVFVCQNEIPAGNYASGTYYGVRAEQPGETAVLTFKDRAMHEFVSNSGSTFYVGGTDTDKVTCRAIANFNSSAIHGSQTNGVPLGRLPQITYKAFVGCGNGYGELNVTDGYVKFGTYGTRIGSVVNTSTSDTGDSLGCTGVCNVAGGKLVTEGARGWEPKPVPHGMLVGWGWPTLSELERPYNGFMNVTGGIVSNISCSTVIGAGKGYGEWHQKGGKTILVAEGVKVGLAGGIGLISVSGGTFTSTYDTYIGGAPVTAFNNGNKLADIGYPTNRHDGVGTLTVSGGRFEVKGNSTSKLYVGADGEGTVEMDGPDGELVVPQLVLAAGTVDAGTENEAQTKATLRFKLDANGKVAPITVTSTLTISDDSELVIDATACPENVFSRLKLINVGSVSGSFAPENITVLGAPRIVSGTSVAWRGKSLSLSLGTRGMAVIFR